MTDTIEATLAERGSRYGSFDEHARITQAIKAAMADSPNWQTLDADMRESLEMVAHKVGRILNGDPAFHDSWHDIVGYVKLVADRLASPVPAPAPQVFGDDVERINAIGMARKALFEGYGLITKNRVTYATSDDTEAQAAARAYNYLADKALR